MCARPGLNEFVEDGLAHSICGGKNNGVVARNVMRHCGAEFSNLNTIRSFYKQWHP